ncbi:hypothetical protein AC578_4800 [Pseudocercospora eumusae]|uniref:BTB domain-containing protein n=1 Tax=Pseudocercospora eumusae TaxID=321146 RepID=A0A139HL78_9PEZI|nr:hypothetical protein AC578_4800 [Pseudocercospora eumusae]
MCKNTYKWQFSSSLVTWGLSTDIMVAKRHFSTMEAEANCIRAIASSFDSADSSGDLTITCNGNSIKCHKYVVSRRSERFKAVLDGDEFRDQPESSIDLPDETDDAAVHAMLEFCYSVNYKSPTPNTSLFHVCMYSLAEKFMIDDLKKLATDRFREAAEMEDDVSLAASIRESYAITTDNEKILKDTIVKLVLHNVQLSQPPTKALDQLTDEIPAYAADLARAAIKNLAPLKRKYRCPGGCGGEFEKALVPSQMYRHYCGIHKKVREWTMAGSTWNANWGREWITD